ncbi:hypothetical protein [Streptomyces buecherae]|uniref:Uncharacterized protein n=1 Tax=Streptomyces buecherae TaxID=2763006 RepID=A0A7H8N358_9ACTN|nr:hypothetical protein [Streptomyces buecherae]QKW48872.1 hypothetical protein HUT08_04190 [Streptomyces buecherae]
MTEISYPFSEPSESGGQAALSQLDWQDMALMWAGDRVDFRLTNPSYSGEALPFSARVINGRTIELRPGAAWVGGFYYRSNSVLTVDIEANPTEKPRVDIIVVRADVPKGSSNIVAVKGQPSKTPIAPRPQRIAGQRWEMVLHEISVPAKDGAITVKQCAPFDAPARVATPWNARATAAHHGVGNFFYDLDSNNNDTQLESWNGRDGYMITRHLGKAKTYVPKIVNTGKLPSGILYRGIWRWIAPNTVSFSIDINNTSNTDVKQSGTGPLSFTLPVNPSSSIGQHFSGQLLNSGYDADLPNFVALHGMSHLGNKTDVVKIYHPSSKRLGEGLDYLLTFPRRSSIVFSGTYEANAL